MKSGDHEVDGTLFSIKGQIGSKNFLKSTFFFNFHKILYLESWNSIFSSIHTCLWSYLLQIWQNSALCKRRIMNFQILSKIFVTLSAFLILNRPNFFLLDFHYISFLQLLILSRLYFILMFAFTSIELVTVKPNYCC